MHMHMHRYMHTYMHIPTYAMCGIWGAYEIRSKRWARMAYMPQDWSGHMLLVFS